MNFSMLFQLYVIFRIVSILGNKVRDNNYHVLFV